ncbi:hypothetical protein D7V86_09190 [bacterium D16-51]|nr:hypothetical protein D7V96_09820 [bacterium D16-59]RKI60369.1 hypothetical protein D7V86_09190 [bacterium D16-51]
MKKNKFKLIYFFKNIRFRERMLLIYIIGGIIPFVFAMLYINHRSQEIMLDQSSKTQAEEISLITSSMKESIRVAEDVAAKIYNNEKVRDAVEKAAKKNYRETKDFEKDCADLGFISDYLDYYGGEISDIKIYVTNTTIGSGSYFKYLSETDIQKQRWYVPTSEEMGNPYWAYGKNDVSGKKVMQLTRMFLGGDGKEKQQFGVLAIELEAEKTTEKVISRKADTLLVYRVNDILATNFWMDKNNLFVLKCLRDAEDEKNSKVVSYEVQDYLLTYERIYLNSNMYYTVATIRSFQELLSDFTKTGMVSIGVVIIGMIMAIGLMATFSVMFGGRINMLRRQMHYVAAGQYELLEPIEGTDEAAQIYQELEQMVEDIQSLTSKVVEEKVQKEKLHTRQKEAEFEMLASQINPHFLYNTLETIRMKAKIDNEPEIEELVKMLAKIMRRNLKVGSQMVTLASEIELLENYLFIQNYRFGDRIQSEISVDNTVDTKILVIPLIMQPFVENAYVHGLESKDEGGFLQVFITQEKETILIKIQDNGAGIDFYRLGEIKRALREGKAVEKGHIGIGNVNQRLRFLYGEEYGVSIESRLEEGTCVTICFPVEGEMDDGE